ncbi:prephenate dehydrogenase [Gordonia phthalatica]|uniref:Prephenate dehydrogenase n=1 Tax=Gordonia phthalatica TaxID=1136941 RepID=A0A0N9NE02_9ACTN|nr:prephenate dehydrogenase [Gordonia phthalatica]ALG83440.1 prephenate dehydrogenase [Gordonia phthalatica]
MCHAETVSAPASRPVCVLGLGLIGGSLLRRLADTGVRAFGYNRGAATVDAAAAAGYAASGDLHATLRQAAEQDAIIVLATPFTALTAMVEAVRDTAPACLLTDVVSVKEEVACLVERIHPNGRYVGGHPMAGTSHSGWAATDPSLFEGAMWMVTTHDDTAADDWLAVAGIARAAGAYVVPAANDAHDRAAAAISHNPHLTAAVTAAVGAGESDLALRLAAGSFRDGTRVAGTAPELQRAMLEANSISLLNTLSETIDRLVAARDALRDHGSVSVLVEAGHRARLKYEAIAGADPEPITGVRIGDDGWQEHLRKQAHQAKVWVG